MTFLHDYTRKSWHFIPTSDRLRFAEFRLRAHVELLHVTQRSSRRPDWIDRLRLRLRPWK
jgi:hypothetical protein